MKYDYLESAYWAFLLKGRVEGYKNHKQSAQKEIEEIEKHIDILKNGPFDGFDVKILCDKHKVAYYGPVRDWLLLPCCAVEF